MSLLTPSTHFARDLARLLAAWVAAIVFVQAMASAIGAVQGPRHLHLRADAAAVHTAVFVHGAAAAEGEAQHHRAEHHDHGGWARHLHLPAGHADPTLDGDAQELGAVAGLVLAAMVGLGASSLGLVAAAEVGHVMRPACAWSCSTHALPLLDRPPRA